VGYFNLRGWRQLDAKIEEWTGGEGAQCRLLIGMQQRPQEELRQTLGFSSGDSHNRLDNATVNRLKKELAADLRAQLTVGAPNNADEAGLQRLARQIRAGKVVVKLYLRHNLHAKLYLLFRLIHYHRSPRYWIRSMDFEQYFRSSTRSRSIHHFRDLYFVDQRIAKIIGATLNSTLFFWWFVSIGNGRNITGTDVEQFPMGDLSGVSLDSLPTIFDRLMVDYKENSFVRVRQDAEFQEFQPSKSKIIMDEIDQVLAQHYGFTDKEMDFILNYDVKYRMGDELFEDDSGE
jgi:hypothetical protein